MVITLNKCFVHRPADLSLIIYSVVILLYLVWQLVGPLPYISINLRKVKVIYRVIFWSKNLPVQIFYDKQHCSLQSIFTTKNDYSIISQCIANRSSAIAQRYDVSQEMSLWHLSNYREAALLKSITIRAKKYKFNKNIPFITVFNQNFNLT